MALADLVASASVWYPLDEASGSALDGIGAIDLTDNATVGAGSGPGTISWSRDFEQGSAEYFNRADNAAYSFGNEDFTIRVLINAESLHAAGSGIVNKWVGGAGGREYSLYHDGSRLTWVVNDNTSGTSVQWSAATSLATWYLVHVWHDSVGNKIGIAVNAGTPVEAAWTTGVHDGANQLEVGHSTGIPGISWDGLISDLVFLRAVMSADERTEDNNGGDPVPFADWDSAVAYTLTADSGTFTLTGTAASLEVGRVLSAASGSFALTGTAASLEVGREVNADSGTFTLAGQDASLEVGRRLVAESGTFTFSGQTAGLFVGRELSAESGAFTLSGSAASLEAGRKLSADSGTYVLSGQDAALTWSNAPAGISGPIAIVAYQFGADSIVAYEWG